QGRVLGTVGVRLEDVAIVAQIAGFPVVVDGRVAVCRRAERLCVPTGGVAGRGVNVGHGIDRSGGDFVGKPVVPGAEIDVGGGEIIDEDLNVAAGVRGGGADEAGHV